MLQPSAFLSWLISAMIVASGSYTVNSLAMAAFFVPGPTFPETIQGPCFSDMVATEIVTNGAIAVTIMIIPSSGLKDVGCSLVHQAMRDNTMWGGGGEVVGLTHVLKRPIHVYELQSTGRR